MFSSDRGLALLDVEAQAGRTRRKPFDQNLVLVDAQGEIIRSVLVPEVTRMASYLVDLRCIDGAITITDFRGYQYVFDPETETVSHVGYIPKC